MEEESYNLMKILSIQEAAQIAKGKQSLIVTGVTGQDGSWMADLLLKETNYEIFGGARRLSVSNHGNVDHLVSESRFHLVNFDLTDAHSINKVVAALNPLYFINFAGQSFVKSSWDFPEQTADANEKGVRSILEAIHHNAPTCRFYNAGSSEEFGDIVYTPQDENHPLRPRSPYGSSKAAARHYIKSYRESYGLYAVQGWLFNHEGTRRGEEFVTRKITKGVARIVKEIADHRTHPTPIELGNLDAVRDWSDAEDCVDAVWRMLNQENYNKEILPAYTFSKYMTNASGYFREELVPRLEEYVVGSGESHSIREFVEIAFTTAGIKGHWEGEKENEKYVMDTLSWPDDVLVKINPANYRPADVEKLCSDPTRIKQELGWKPKTSFKQLVEKMVKNDLV